MNAEAKPKEPRRLSTPLVLALTSAMICVGVAGFLLRGGPEPEEQPADTLPAIVVDDTTPERAAESFLDAWRRREHEVAADLSVGEARAAVDERAARDAAMSDHERELKRQGWDAMAAERLGLAIREAEQLEGGRMALRGIAEGTFLDQPYEREMEFVLRPEAEVWRVEGFHFGEILTEVPRLLELE